MQSGRIADSQISVDGRHICAPHSMFRLFNNSHVIFYGGNAAGFIDITQYVEVNLLELHTITGLLTTGLTTQGFGGGMWIEQFLVHFESVDGNDQWFTYKNIDGSNKVSDLLGQIIDP